MIPTVRQRSIPRNSWKTKQQQSSLHKATARSVVFPCADVIEWLLFKTYTKNRLITDVDGDAIVSFHSIASNCYYKFLILEANLTSESIESLRINYVAFMKHMFEKQRRFSVKSPMFSIALIPLCTCTWCLYTLMICGII